MAHYALHRALFYQGAHVIILSKGEDAAAEVLGYCKFIHSRLPVHLQPVMGRDQFRLLTFPSLNSKIRALPSTESSGIGFGGASLIIPDEFDFHPYADQNFSEIKPMIDAGGKRQLAILSARNLESADNSRFKTLFRSARTGESQFFPHFIPYNVMPYRDEKWYEGQFIDMEPWVVEARYPKTEEEALAPAKALCYFDTKTLDKMKAEDCFPPIEIRRNGIIRIYKPAIVGRKYCMAVDPTEGGDPFAMGIMDWQSCEVVVTVHGRTDSDEQAKIILELYEEYNKPFFSLERNAGGVNLRDKVKGNITNWYRKDPIKHSDVLGFYMGSDNRPVVLLKYKEEAIYKRQVRIYDKQAIEEHYSFIQEPAKQPRAQKGSHDDWVMMLAQLWAIRNSMTHGEYKVRSFKYKE